GGGVPDGDGEAAGGLVAGGVGGRAADGRRAQREGGAGRLVAADADRAVDEVRSGRGVADCRAGGTGRLGRDIGGGLQRGGGGVNDSDLEAAAGGVARVVGGRAGHRSGPEGEGGIGGRRAARGYRPVHTVTGRRRVGDDRAGCARRLGGDAGWQNQERA